jgi:hypothetical protein
MGIATTAMTQAAPTCVTVAGAQWLWLPPHRWKGNALLRAKLNLSKINNQASAIVTLTSN